MSKFWFNLGKCFVIVIGIMTIFIGAGWITFNPWTLGAAGMLLILHGIAEWQ